MVPEITWSFDALNTYNSVIDYLQNEWTEKEVKNFANRTREKLKIIQLQPKIGRLVNKKLHIHRTLVHKKTTLFYRYRPNKKRDRIAIVLEQSAKSTTIEIQGIAASQKLFRCFLYNGRLFSLPVPPYAVAEVEIEIKGHIFVALAISGNVERSKVVE